MLSHLKISETMLIGRRGGLTKNNRHDTCEVKVNRSVVSVDITNTEGVDSVALSRENPMKRPSKSLPVIFLMRVRWVLVIGD